MTPSRPRPHNGLSAGLGFLAPNILGFLLFTAVPVLVSLVLAFTNWNLRESVHLQFTGLHNFAELLLDQKFWLYFVNTVYLMLGLPFSIAGSLALALLLHEMRLTQHLAGRFMHAALSLVLAAVIAGGVLAMDAAWSRWLCGLVLLTGVIYAAGVLMGIVVFRTLYYLPNFTNGVALFILWKALYNPEFGPINALLRLFVENPPQWLTSANNLFGLSPESVACQAKFFGLGARDAINLMGIVTGIGGGNMLLYLAGLSNISPELYEAAGVDGASGWQKFRHITWPQLAPTTFFIVIMSTIGGLQGGFEVARVMTSGGPAGTTTTLSYYIYQAAFQRMEFGYASAIAWVLFTIVFALTLLNWKFGNRHVSE
jgi:multiple sugar transport system permease protein